MHLEGPQRLPGRMPLRPAPHYFLRCPFRRGLQSSDLGRTAASKFRIRIQSKALHELKCVIYRRFARSAAALDGRLSHQNRTIVRLYATMWRFSSIFIFLKIRGLLKILQRGYLLSVVIINTTLDDRGYCLPDWLLSRSSSALKTKPQPIRIRTRRTCGLQCAI